MDRSPPLRAWLRIDEERQLSRVLGGIADLERLAEVFDAIIDCDSDAELFVRMRM